MRILVAEDNPDNMEILTRRLRRAGHDVCGAPNGRDAVDRAGAYRPDLRVMDLSMPIMSGLEAVAVIRRRESANRKTPIIMLTAHAMQSDKEKCLAAGCDAFATKPVDFQALLKLIGHFEERAT